MTSSNCSISEVVSSRGLGRDLLICTPSNEPASMDSDVAPVTWGSGTRYTGTGNRPAHQRCDCETGSSLLSWPWPWPCSAAMPEASPSVWLSGRSRSLPDKIICKEQKRLLLLQIHRPHCNTISITKIQAKVTLSKEINKVLVSNPKDKEFRKIL